MSEQILNLGQPALVTRQTDPVITPQPYSSPVDFTAQYPQPLDTTEIIAMCEEINLLKYIPEMGTALKAEQWRELNSLAFTSGSAYISFADGSCPEEYTHNGTNTTVDIKSIGAKKTLSISDIMHSQAVASANWNGINNLVGAVPSFSGLPGAGTAGTFQREVVSNVKEKEMRLAATLVLNGEDRLLVNGNHVSNSLAFTGIENWEAAYSVNFHTGTSGTGTFSASVFDRFLSEGCAAPTVIMGHPAAIQEMMSAYFQLGFQGSQVIQYDNGNRLIPGFNFSAYVNTGIGQLQVVGDRNFTRTDNNDGTFDATLYAMRMSHNGEPLVYRITQIPLAMTDLAPGCTAVSFQIWKRTALVIKHACAHSKYSAIFSGNVLTTCAVVGV